MPEFQLVCTDDDGTITTKDFSSPYLSETVDKIEDFLHGVGFVFDSLDLVVGQEDPKGSINLDTPDENIDEKIQQILDPNFTT